MRYSFYYKLLLALAVLFAGYSQAHCRELRLTVDELFAKVDTASIAIKSQHTGVEAAQSGIAQERSRYLPDINMQLSVGYDGNALLSNRDFGNATWVHTPHFDNSFSMQLVQPVYDGGAIKAGVEMARLQYQGAMVSERRTRLDERYRALQQYLDIYKVLNRMQVYAHNIALAERLLNDITNKYNQGMALQNDITRYELQLEQLRLALKQLGNQRSVLNHQLCNTLHIAYDNIIVPDEALLAAAYGKAPEEEWQLQAASHSPLIAQQQLLSRQTATQEKVVRSESLPKLNVVVGDEFNGPITYEVPPINKNINVWYIGIGVSYNLGSLYKNNHRLKQASIATRKARENCTVTAEQVNNSVQQAHVLYLQSYDELATQVKSVELADQNYKVVNDRYLNQLALVTDMVDASNVKLQAELLEVDARINIALAYYRLKYVAGLL